MKHHILSIIIFPILVFSQQKELGQKFINSLLLQKDYAIAYSYFDEGLKMQLPLGTLLQTVEQLETQIGKYKYTIDINNENSKFYFYSEFEKMKLDINLNFTEDNKINGFFFKPHKEFDEQGQLGQTLNIRSNDIELQGTLLTPNNSFHKIVIFIHGSGPNDRDETIYENKPFKDIADNLYQKGISSYRFDKRTLTNPETFNDKSTIKDEVINDVINVIKHFKDEPQFSNYEIVVLGHSLGAYLLPKIANEYNQISKIILLAGNARPLEQLIQEQYEYLYEINPTKELNEELRKVKEQIEVLNSTKFNLETPKENLPLNLSAHYWNSLLEYKPLKEVKKVNIPIFILQGETDYQVTMKDFDLWKSTLKNNKKAKLISYPYLNHLFMKGNSKSNPNEYMIKSSVDEKVIDDIFKFITE